jgi:hypothetical protein
VVISSFIAEQTIFQSTAIFAGLPFNGQSRICVYKVSIYKQNGQWKKDRGMIYHVSNNEEITMQK